MSAFDEFTALLDSTNPMKHLLQSLREEPAYLLRDICRQFERTGRPVPDHNVLPTGFMHETSLGVLLAAGLVKRYSGETLALYVYEPTPEGQEFCRRLEEDGFFDRLKRSQ